MSSSGSGAGGVPRWLRDGRGGEGGGAERAAAAAYSVRSVSLAGKVVDQQIPPCALLRNLDGIKKKDTVT